MKDDKPMLTILRIQTEELSDKVNEPTSEQKKTLIRSAIYGAMVGAAIGAMDDTVGNDFLAGSMIGGGFVGGIRECYHDGEELLANSMLGSATATISYAVVKCIKKYYL